MIFGLLSFTLTLLTFIYFLLAKPLNLLKLFREGVIQSSFIYSNFIFATITAILTSYVILFEWNDLFPLNLYNYTKRQQLLCEYTIGYLLVEISFGIYHLIFNPQDIKQLKGYLIYHFIILLAYSTVIYYKNAGIVILFTLWGEIYTIYGYIIYWFYYYPFFVVNRKIIEIIDLLIFTINRIFAIWFLVIISLMEFSDLLSQTHKIVQFLFLLCALIFNHYWWFIEIHSYYERCFVTASIGSD